MKFKILAVIMSTLSALSSCAQGDVKVLVPEQFADYLSTTPDAMLIDARTPEEYAAGYIPGAVNIDAQSADFIDIIKSHVPTTQAIALYCRSGRRSAEAAKKLIGAGYKVTDLDGGILAWEKALLPVTNGIADIYTTPGDKQVEIQPLLHASLRINYNGTEIEVDPVRKLGDRTTDYSQFPKADLILVTHEHYDHLDPEAIKTLSKADTIVIANPNSANILGYGKVMKNGDSLTLKEEIEIQAVPAYNVSPDRLQFHPKGRDNGYVLTLDGLRIYIAGDTEVIPEMESLKDIDIAFLPCNLPYTMTPEQLIEAAKTIKPKVLYPYHFGNTDLSSVPAALAPYGIDVRIRPFDP